MLSADGETGLTLWTELLLLIFRASAFDSERCLEKKDAFEAVIGVLGVFVLTLRGGGVIMPSEATGAGIAAILEAVGVLRGNRFSGGRRSGCRFFFLTCCEFLCSTSPFESCFLVCSVLTGSRVEARPDRLLVDMLLILLASNGPLILRCMKNGGSAGVSFGDSYAFGIAGTGGTSNSSSFPAELWIRGFGVGNREEFSGGGNCGMRGWSEPVDVRAVL